MVLHSQFQDFILFLYIHMAISDGSLHSCEEQVILNKMAKLFPEETDSKKKLQMALTEYKALDHAMTMDVIRETFKHFDKVTFAQKYKVYADMYDIVNADGKVEESEKNALTGLKEIIDMNAQTKQA
ncbi:MAG TPA: TerB family tellurite resistance protein [Cyclobacteriaceae bacterium]|nr:TerB family tellurite resistance protein [Cyclobacteriaceae bacterium]